MKRNINLIIISAFGFLLNSLPTWAQESTPTRSTLHKILDWIIELTVKYSFQVVGGILILVAGWIAAGIASRIVNEFLEKYHLDITVTKFLVGSVKLSIMLLAALAALGKFGIEVAPFIAGLSVVGFGTSFALQGPLSNYAAGVSLIFTKPFKVGDIIEVAQNVGEVEDISLSRTALRTIDGTIIVIPNKHIIGEVIQNYSHYKKLEINIGVDYAADIQRAIRLITEAIKSESKVIQDKECKVGISAFLDDRVNITARLWCEQAHYWDVLFNINQKILHDFRRESIEIPYPKRELIQRDKH